MTMLWMPGTGCPESESTVVLRIEIRVLCILSYAGEVTLFNWVEYIKEEHSHLYELPQQAAENGSDSQAVSERLRSRDKNP